MRSLSAVLALAASVFGSGPAAAISFHVMHPPTSFGMGCSLAPAAQLALETTGITHVSLIGKVSDGWLFSGQDPHGTYRYRVLKDCSIRLVLAD